MSAINGTSNGSVPNKTPTTVSPASYHYTSSTSLLNASTKPVPPPTLPKYSSGSPATYRLASLERLANRQRLFEQPATGGDATVGFCYFWADAAICGGPSGLVFLT